MKQNKIGIAYDVENRIIFQPIAQDVWLRGIKNTAVVADVFTLQGCFRYHLTLVVILFGELHYALSTCVILTRQKVCSFLLYLIFS